MFLLRDVGFMQNGFDDAISQFMYGIHNGFLDKVLGTITHLGDSGIFWIILTFILLLSKKNRRGGFILMIALIIDVTINDGLIKNVVGRNRPFMEHPEYLDAVRNVLAVPHSGSFVSGHSAASFACATAIFLHYRKDKRYWISGFVLATLIAFSRIYLLVHYFTDVLGGIILGILIGICAFYLMKLIDIIVAKIKKQEVHELFMYNE